MPESPRIDPRAALVARLPLWLLVFAVLASALGGGLTGAPGDGTLGYLLRGAGGGLLLFLFPSLSVLYRIRPAGIDSLGAMLLLCAIVNPLVLTLGGELLVLVGVTRTPMWILALCVLPTVSLEWVLRLRRPPISRGPDPALVLVLPVLVMGFIVVADPSTHRIVESHLLPDQTREQLAALREGTGIEPELRRDPGLGVITEREVVGQYEQRWDNSAADSRGAELRWLIHNDGPREQEVTLWIDEQLHARYHVQARFDPERHPRDYPPCNTLAVERLEFSPGRHTVALRQADGAAPLRLLDLTGVPRDELIPRLGGGFQIVDVGDVQQVLDIARNFDTHALPWVGNRSQSLQFVGGGVTVADLPLYHLVLNLALNLIGDDLAGANALFVWLLGWTVLGLLVVFDPGRADRPATWAAAAVLSGGVALLLWRLLPPNDEALFLDAYMTLAGVALVAFTLRRSALGGAVAAAVIACTMRAGQVWMVLSALGFLLHAPRSWRTAVRLFGPALALSAVLWLAVGFASSHPALGNAAAGVFAEDVSDRFLYFAMAWDPAGLLRERWVVHTLLFLGFCVAGSGGLLVAGVFARSRRIRALATGLGLYLITLSLLAHHRVAYAAPLIVVGIAVGLAALRGSRMGGGQHPQGWRPLVVGLAAILVAANAGRLATATDDYTRTEGDRVLWYSTYPGEPARWLALSALGEFEHGSPEVAHDLLIHAATLYPYHLPHLSYHLGRVAMARGRPVEAAEMFELAARLEEGACARTRAGALLMATTGELEHARGVVQQNPACADSLDDAGFADLLARVAEGTEAPEAHLGGQTGDLDIRNCYLTEAYGWPFDVPPSVPLPPR